MPSTSWLDEDSKTVRIDDYARQLDAFVTAMADGRIDDKAPLEPWPSDDVWLWTATYTAVVRRQS